MNQDWRFLYTPYCEAEYNFALDEALFLQAEENNVPVLRIYSWENPAISIGYFQKSSVFNLKKCQQEKVSFLRRITGGRAILHQKELTYSFIAPKSFFCALGDTVSKTYRILSQALLQGLKNFGLEAQWIPQEQENFTLISSVACFESQSRFEIQLKGRKIIGSAQKRTEKALIQQGSCPLFSGRFSLKDFLKNPVGVEDGFFTLSDILKQQLEWEGLARALKRGLETYFGVSLVDSSISKGEKKLANKLRQVKYCTEAWNLYR